MKNADTAKVTDIALMLGPLSRGASGSQPDYFTKTVALADDISLGRHPLTERVLTACQSPGENWTRYHEWSIYEIWRTGAPIRVDGTGGFNNDRRLSTVLQLSRLVRPTSIGYARAARMIEWDGHPVEIVPARAEGRGSRMFVADEKTDWLRDTDVDPLRAIIGTFDPDKLPERVKAGMRHFEYAHGLDDFNTRWPLITTAAESLIHTDERRKVFGPGGKRVTEQFVTRLFRLGQRVAGVAWTESDLEQAYEDRSGFAHGRGVGTAPLADLVARYQAFEGNVRRVLHQLIMDPTFAAIFVASVAMHSESSAMASTNGFLNLAMRSTGSQIDWP